MRVRLETMKRENIDQGEKKQNLKVKAKQIKPVLSDPDVKKPLEEFHQKKMLLSPFIKHQTILHLNFENTTFPNY